MFAIYDNVAKFFVSKPEIIIIMIQSLSVVWTSSGGTVRKMTKFYAM